MAVVEMDHLLTKALPLMIGVSDLGLNWTGDTQGSGP